MDHPHKAKLFNLHRVQFELNAVFSELSHRPLRPRPVGSIFRLGGLFSGHENLGRVVICNDHNMQCLQQLGVQGAKPPEAHEISLSLRS